MKILYAVALLSGTLFGQQIADPTKQPTDSWPTYHGDYKGTHYSPLKQINTANARNLSVPGVTEAMARHETRSGIPRIAIRSAREPSDGNGRRLVICE